MLALKNITKDYVSGDLTVEALKNVNLAFRKSEFVSILGPSGCGKTTMLNIIGGLDRYTNGDLFINGISTKEFKDGDWDSYRNHSVGFVFQSYNLIPHLTVMQNVELALTLGGISKEERHKRVVAVLEKVGLKEQIKKMPNQLSGGQMQRVSIARALVNDPEIILADEPTGALDTVTSAQIADLLKEIAADRLVIMVTHNNDLADLYSTRIVKLLDGEIIDDSNPLSFDEEEKECAKIQENSIIIEQSKIEQAKSSANLEKSESSNENKKARKHWWQFYKRKLSADGKTKSSMSFFTALGLSFKNLLSKKGRTIMISIAGSIGIIGVALVLCISNGFSNYISKMQSDILSGYPLEISPYAVDPMAVMKPSTGNDLEEYPDGDGIYINEMKIEGLTHENTITDEYVEYVKKMDQSLVNNIQYVKGIQMNVIAKTDSGEFKSIASQTNDDLMKILGANGPIGSELLSNENFIRTQYDVIAGHYPKNANEIALVVDKRNRVNVTVLDAMGVNYNSSSQFKFDDFLGKTFKLINNNNYYQKGADGYFSPKNLDESMYNSGENLTISCILRIDEKAPLSLLSNGIQYLPSLAEKFYNDNKNSEIATAQKKNTEGSVLNKLVKFKDYAYTDPFTGSVTKVSGEILRETTMKILGASSTPYIIQIFPKDFSSKSKIKDYLNQYNFDNFDDETDYIKVTDQSEMVTTTMENMVDIISYVLVAFASISLVVSSVMIGVITYASVAERTKEIGVLRSIGARKRDISRVFNAETLLIGFTAGLIGVLVAFLLTFPISAIITAVAGQMATKMAVMNPLHAVVLVAISMCLTFIAGLIPARIASKKDPVVALRS